MEEKIDNSNQNVHTNTLEQSKINHHTQTSSPKIIKLKPYEPQKKI